MLATTWSRLALDQKGTSMDLEACSYEMEERSHRTVGIGSMDEKDGSRNGRNPTQGKQGYKEKDFRV